MCAALHAQWIVGVDYGYGTDGLHTWDNGGNQSSIAEEVFRRADGYEVFGEGWALYAETLGFELGLYKDPLSRFGLLRDQALRAARLVVDTGIHAFGWSRSQAIDFMMERTGKQRPFVTSEVDRYTSWPAQALAYMIGELKIIELRDRAKARLGERFDIRRFHSVVLDQGSVPLPVLERAVDEWIAAGGGTVVNQSSTAKLSSTGEPR